MKYIRRKGHQLEGQMLQIWLIGFSFFSFRIEAANHYCIHDSMKVFSINADSDQTETLFTSHGDMEAHVPRQRCLWDVKINRMTEPLQLVLSLRRGRLWQEAANGTGCPSELSVALQDSKYLWIWKNGLDLPKAPLIVAVMNSSQQLIVRFSTGDLQSEAVCGRIELTIGVAKKGYCGRNMLLHGHRCLFVSDEKLELSDLTGTGAELAGISGIEQLRDLLSDNEKRRAKHPYKAPLDLTGSTRVGIFRCTGSNWTFYLNSSSDGCAAAPFVQEGQEGQQNSSRESTSWTIQCASIQATIRSTQISTIEYDNCSQPLPYLLSFPINPAVQLGDNTRNKSCNVIDSDICNLKRTNVQQRLSTSGTSCPRVAVLMVLAGHLMAMAAFCLINIHF